MENLKIFIVDDDRWYSTLLTKHLRHIEHLPTMYGRKLHLIEFDEGNECLKSLHRRPDMIILDYYLDGQNQNGTDILRKIKETNPAIPVFFLSSQNEVCITSEIMKLGAADCVSKDKGGMQRIASLVQNHLTMKANEKEKQGQNQLRILMAVMGLLVALTLYYW